MRLRWLFGVGMVKSGGRRAAWVKDLRRIIVDDNVTYEAPVAIEVGDFSTDTLGHWGRGFDQTYERRSFWW